MKARGSGLGPVSNSNPQRLPLPSFKQPRRNSSPSMRTENNKVLKKLNKRGTLSDGDTNVNAADKGQGNTGNTALPEDLSASQTSNLTPEQIQKPINSNATDAGNITSSTVSSPTPDNGFKNFIKNIGKFFIYLGEAILKWFEKIIQYFKKNPKEDISTDENPQNIKGSPNSNSSNVNNSSSDKDPSNSTTNVTDNGTDPQNKSQTSVKNSTHQDNNLDDISQTSDNSHTNTNSKQVIHGNEPNTIIADQNKKYTSQVDFINANNGTIIDCGSSGNNCFLLSVLTAINGKKASYEEAENLRIRIKSEVSQKYQDLCRNLPNQIRQFLQEKTEKLIKPLKDIQNNPNEFVKNCPVSKSDLDNFLKKLEKLLSDISDPNIKNEDSILGTLDESPAYNDLNRIISQLEDFKDNWKAITSAYPNPPGLQHTLLLLQNLKDLRAPMQRLDTTRKEIELLNPGEQIDPTGPVGSWIAKDIKKTLVIFPDSFEYEPGECRFFTSNGDAGKVKGNSWPEITQEINASCTVDSSNMVCLFYSGNGNSGHYQWLSFQ